MGDKLTWKPDAQGRDTRWEGGLIRYEARGRATFILERSVRGVRYKFSTKTHSASAALKHLSRFESDPIAYTKKPEADNAVYLTEEMAEDFITWSREVKQNSPNWISTQRIYLEHWRERLFGRDLRHLSLRDDVDTALDHWEKGRPHRIKVLKALMAWLRKVKRTLKSAEDATIDLPVPQSRPEQARRLKAFPRDHFDLALEHLTGSVRDGLIILGATGCHYSELVRFIQEGSIEPVPNGSKDGIAVLVFRHKSGVPHRVRVGKQALASAERLKERKGVAWDHHTFNAALKSACDAAGIPVFHAGQLRHSVATWAVNEGADPAAVAAFLGHRSVTTMRRFYSTHAAPKRVPTLVR